MLGLALYEETLCEGCGLPPSVTSDPENHVFKIENTVCPACKSWARYGRVQAAQDKAGWDARGENAQPASPHPSDGRHTKLRQLTAEEATAARAGAQPASEPEAAAAAGRPRRAAGQRTTKNAAGSSRSASGQSGRRARP